MRLPPRPAALRAALVTPLWLRGNRWQDLLHAPARLDPVRPLPAPALMLAERTLRVLARVPGSPWRATCLYRCVAATLLWRDHGIPSVLRIGAAATLSSIAEPGVRAHAWVEDGAGRVIYERADGYSALA